MSRQVKKVVFPVAGMGTRFLPATKASAKEMMPVVDKPLIQYAVEEAIESGYDQLIFVTGRGKRAIADHFDVSYELEMELESRGKHQMLKMIQNIVPQHVHTVFIRQPKPLGLGHAVLMAKRVVGEEPFAVVLADDLIDGGEVPCLKQMNKIYEYRGSSVLATEEVDPQETDKYGIVKIDKLENRTGRVEKIVEKPSPDKAPSNLAVVGRYILSPRIFELLEKTGKGAGGEIQLTDAISDLLDKEEVLAYAYEGKRYDCGSKLGYLQATVEYGLKHPELSDEFRAYLNSLTH